MIQAGGDGGGGPVIVLRSRSQEIASSTYSCLVVSLYFVQDCSIPPPWYPSSLVSLLSSIPQFGGCKDKPSAGTQERTHYCVL